MKNKIKEPISKGYAKVPVVMQMEALECGAASLTMILAYYDKWIPLEEVRKDCGVSRDGSNAKNILRAARSYGLIAQGFKYELDDVKNNAMYPCIIHWNFNHFVVLCGFKNNKAIINDPGKGTYSVSMEIFDNSFTGICLMFCPGEDFEPSGHEKSMVKYAWSKMKDMGATVAFVIITTIISSLIAIITPGFMRIFVDRLLTRQNPRWVVPFIFALTCFSIIQIVLAAIGSVYSLRLDGKMSVVGNSEYTWKTLKLPMEFFSQRLTGDIEQRKSMNASVSSILVNTFSPLLIDAAMMVFYLVVMFKYSWILTVIGLASILINLWLSRLISKKRINITRVQMRDSGKLAGTTSSGIQMIETIKASGAEGGFFEKWSGYQASVNTQQVKFEKVNRYYGLIPTIVSTLTDIAILMTGVFLTMEGEFTIGMIMAFQGYMLSFRSPATKLITAGQTLQELRIKMERLEDVMSYPDDEIFDMKDDLPSEDEVYDKLTGNLEMRHVTFGYNRLGDPLIRDFNLNLEKGKRVAFVGASGCGKSTLSKLISGINKPWEGQILFDGKEMKDIDRSVFTGSVAVVDQDIILFEDTIANNIKMWDESIEDYEMILAARDAQIHEDIILREGGYQYVLCEGGKDFSGGQKQRLEIARVLAQDPTIIILDEATSALDAKTEYDVVNAIKDRGITCIVVAHRLSTIRDCDEIIVLEHGEVVERGTHEELMKLNGAYTELVTSE